MHRCAEFRQDYCLRGKQMGVGPALVPLLQMQVFLLLKKGENMKQKCFFIIKSNIDKEFSSKSGFKPINKWSDSLRLKNEKPYVKVTLFNQKLSHLRSNKSIWKIHSFLVSKFRCHFDGVWCVAANLPISSQQSNCRQPMISKSICSKAICS